MNHFMSIANPYSQYFRGRLEGKKKFEDELTTYGNISVCLSKNHE